jgi:hypothetical protein
VLQYATAQYGVERTVAERQRSRIRARMDREVGIPLQRPHARLDVWLVVERGDVESAPPQEIAYLAVAAAPVENTPGTVGADSVGDRPVLLHLRPRAEVHVATAWVGARELLVMHGPENSRRYSASERAPVGR